MSLFEKEIVHLNGGERHGFIYLLLLISYHFKLLPGEGGVGLFFILFFLLLYLFLVIFLVFFYFLKGGRGHKLFFNLLRGEGIGLISLFYQGYC
jgi:hypothetical protein